MPLLASWIDRLKGRGRTRVHAMELYAKIVAQARRPVFYQRYAVADSLDGRFDLIVLHLHLVLKRLGGLMGGETLQRALQEVFFADLDRSLREMGVGDLSVGKRVKQMARAFYGRVAAYDMPLREGDREALAAALVRNLWRGADPGDGVAEALAAHLVAQARHLAAQPDADIAQARLGFLLPGDADHGTQRIAEGRPS